MPRPATWFWAAVVLVALAFVGALVKAMLAPGYDEYAPPPEGWVKRLIPAGGVLLHNEVHEGHEVIIFREPGDVISITLVCPRHDESDRRGTFGSLGAVGVSPDPFRTLSVISPLLPKHVDLSRFQVDAGFVGAFEITRQEDITYRDGTKTEWERTWTVPWTDAQQ